MRGVVLAVGGGVLTSALALFLLMPVRGVDSAPPACWAALGYSVPCSPGLAFGVALVAGLLVGSAVFWWSRQGRRS